MKKLLMKWFGISATKQLPFDIEAVKKGARCVTRNGKEAVFDEETSDFLYPLRFMVSDTTNTYSLDGFYLSDKSESKHDLFIAGEKTLREVLREVWGTPLRFKLMAFVNVAWNVLSAAALYLIIRAMVVGSLGHVLLYSVGVIGINSIYKTNVRK